MAQGAAAAVAALALGLCAVLAVSLVSEWEGAPENYYKEAVISHASPKTWRDYLVEAQSDVTSSKGDMADFHNWMKSDEEKEAEAAQTQALLDKKLLMHKIEEASSAVEEELLRAKQVQLAVAKNPAAVKRARAAVLATQKQIAKAAASVHSTRLNMKKQLAIATAAAKKAKGTEQEAAVEKIRAAVAGLVSTVAGVSLKGMVMPSTPLINKKKLQKLPMKKKLAQVKKKLKESVKHEVSHAVNKKKAIELAAKHHAAVAHMSHLAKKLAIAREKAKRKKGVAMKAERHAKAAAAHVARAHAKAKKKAAKAKKQFSDFMKDVIKDTAKAKRAKGHSAKVAAIKALALAKKRLAAAHHATKKAQTREQKIATQEAAMKKDEAKTATLVRSLKHKYEKAKDKHRKAVVKLAAKIKSKKIKGEIKSNKVHHKGKTKAHKSKKALVKKAMAKVKKSKPAKKNKRTVHALAKQHVKTLTKKAEKAATSLSKALDRLGKMEILAQAMEVSD
jgi:hypothetical protein